MFKFLQKKKALTQEMNTASTPERKPGESVVVVIPRNKTAGIPVTPGTALTFSAIYRAISFISQTFAILPWGVYEGYDIKTSDPVHYILRRRPNPEMSPFDFKRLMVSQALSWGNGYAEIEFDNAGRPVHLWPLHAAGVCPVRGEDGALWYRVTSGGYMTHLPSNRVFHVRNVGSDGIVGYSVIGLAARTVGMGIAAEEFGAGLLKNQAIPSGLLETDKELSAAAASRLSEGFSGNYSGAVNAGRIVVLEEGLKFRELTFKPEDLQFIQSRQFTVEEVARWFGLPPHKLADMSHATFSNIEHLSIEVVNDAITPWCKEFEEEADFKLLGRRKTGAYTKIDLRGLLRGDVASRTAHYLAMLDRGVYSINEVRGFEDMAPIPGGDHHFVPLNTTTLEKAINGGSQAPEQITAPKEVGNEPESSE